MNDPRIIVNAVPASKTSKLSRDGVDVVVDDDGFEGGGGHDSIRLTFGSQP